MHVKISDIENTKIEGVSVHMAKDDVSSEEGYFVWKESPLTAKFESGAVSGGIIEAWHHKLEFAEAEYHVDQEMFYFVSGTAIMLFVDLKEGIADPESVQVVRIPAGTQLIIERGKGHFVAIAEGNEPVKIVVAAPKMEAPRVELNEVVYAE